MNILRITCQWTGFPGGPGYSNFHFAAGAGFFDGGLLGDTDQVAADAAAQRVRDAFAAMRSRLPTQTFVAVQPEAAILDSDSGKIVGTVDVEVAPVGSSASGTTHAGPVGAVVNWRTNDYRFGRRIRGRTFLVPLNSSSYEGNGTLLDTARADLQEFADTMMGGTGDVDFGVWSRPRNGSGGVFASVTSAAVPDMAAVLRSRRD